MSMIGSLTRISEDVRVELHKNPEAIIGLLYPEDAAERGQRDWERFLSELIASIGLAIVEGTGG